MCLLINQPTTAPVLPAHWLSDFFSYNSDGVGVMYSENNCLITEKILPKTDAEFIAFYNAHIAGKDCAYHLRMRTHGDTDLENCHPYMVLNRADHGIDLALMHNGILSTGNKADPSKSDTWHYIRDYLRPMLSGNPEFFMHPAFSKIVGDHIGSGNKFVLMDNAGRVATINQSAGVFWGGLWLSNTYAWTAPTSTSKSAPVNKKAHKLAKLATQQVSKQPERATYAPTYGYSRAGYGLAGSQVYPSWDNWDDSYSKTPSTQTSARNTRWDFDDNVAEYLMVLSDMDLDRASSVSLGASVDFAEMYGIDAFAEIVEMTIDGDISEEWFVNLITDPAKARATFAWLKPLNNYEDA